MILLGRKKFRKKLENEPKKEGTIPIASLEHCKKTYEGNFNNQRLFIS